MLADEIQHNIFIRIDILLMIKIKKAILCLLAVSVVFVSAGCGHAIVIKGDKVDNNSYIYYNGNEISGVPVGTDKPLSDTSESKTDSSVISSNSVVTTPPPVSVTVTGSETSAPETMPAVPETEMTVPPVETVTEETTTTAPPQTTTTQSTTTVKTEKPKPDVSMPEDNLPVNNYKALNHSEVKGVWISYFELYPILTGKSESSFRKGIGQYYDNASALGLNTVYVHVRPYGDAIYRSDYYPWSKYCTGYIGEDPGYDPLEVMIEEAHKRNISFHAWVNPLRCSQENDAPQIDDSYPVKKWYNYNDGDYISKVSSYWYLNPAYDEVTDLIALGTAEIVSRYDVDGVHIDDYFYPTKESWFDNKSFVQSEYSDLSQFRLDNCTKMVYKMYEAVKSHNSTALFGVSAQGNVHNNLNELYADVEKWSREEGYVDYMAPQIYYGFENSGQPYASVVDQWDEMLRGTGKKLIPGLAVYKIGAEDTWAGSGKYEWIDNKEIIKRQIEKARTADNYSGIILYSYQFIFTPENSVKDAVNEEIEAFKPLLS